jgi:hypothetical protein
MPRYLFNKQKSSLALVFGIEDVGDLRKLILPVTRIDFFTSRWIFIGARVITQRHKNPWMCIGLIRS